MSDPSQPSSGGTVGTYTCPWCRTVSDASGVSCPGCGAPINVRIVETRSGWYELPAVKDMARIQFGQSYCQIEGKYVPVADFSLTGPDSVFFTHHLLLWKDPSVVISPLPLRGGWKRLFAGLPLVMTQAHGPGHIAFSRDKPGETVALPIQPGFAVDIREHVFMVATGEVFYDWFNTGIWFQTRNGDERETHYPVGMFMDRFPSQQQPGLLLLHASGNAFVRYLQPGETILIKPTALLFKDTSVQMQLHFERPRGTWMSWRSWGNRYLWLRLHGPGRVAVESAFEKLEDPGHDLASSSPATWQYW